MNHLDGTPTERAHRIMTTSHGDSHGQPQGLLDVVQRLRRAREYTMESCSPEIEARP